MKRLVIISHTEHYQLVDGSIVGFGPTVTEINHLLPLFDAIDHIAMLHKGTAPAHALPYSSEHITFVAIPVLGGQGFKAKFAILINAMSIIKTLRKTLQKADYFQFRGPTGIGVFVVPYLIVCSHKKGWFKYAGNWKQDHAPWAYRWQRWWFKNQKRPVTINGNWANQPQQCLSFENPCLTDAELQEGQRTIRGKALNPSALQVCFVGRLEAEKGIGVMIEALTTLPLKIQQQVHTVHVVGGGQDAQVYQHKAEVSGINFKFYGLLPRQEVHNIYKTCHAIVLPSASEGFPKVIAEAMNYGCVPIVSKVSSISQYIKHGRNGLLLETITTEALRVVLANFFEIKSEDYLQMIQAGGQHAERFTYTYYTERLRKDVLCAYKDDPLDDPLLEGDKRIL